MPEWSMKANINCNDGEKTGWLFNDVKPGTSQKRWIRWSEIMMKLNKPRHKPKRIRRVTNFAVVRCVKSQTYTESFKI